VFTAAAANNENSHGVKRNRLGCAGNRKPETRATFVLVIPWAESAGLISPYGE
jgi:hypothetical protein